MIVKPNKKTTDQAESMVSDQRAAAICVVGSALTGKHSLISDIVGTNVKGEGPYTWQIDNKYYSCSVRLDVHRLETTTEDPAANNSTKTYDAVVAVFNSEQKDSLSALQKWWASYKESSDPSIKLAVATGDEVTDCLLQSAEEWCLEEMIELVVLNAKSIPNGKTDTSAADDDNEDELELETVGIARVKEALEAHMWPGLQLKPRNQPLPSTKQPGIAEPASGGDTTDNSALDIEALAMLEAELPPVDGFEKVFMEAAGARERLQQLGEAERREEAANIMLRLIQAMDEEDLLDDSDDESEDVNE